MLSILAAWADGLHWSPSDCDFSPHAPLDRFGRASSRRDEARPKAGQTVSGSGLLGALLNGVINRATPRRCLHRDRCLRFATGRVVEMNRLLRCLNWSP